LEKPISPDPRECLEIEEKANALGRRITVCHVLRYTNFFGKIKDILDSGELGKIVAIKHSENIGNFHMAHSFVRGNWRNDQLSSPIILQKSCHDLDILLWLTGKHCKQVAAFGSLSYFKETNAPAGSSDRCLTCPVAESCRYDARKCYLPTLGQWPTDVVCLEQTETALMKALKDGPYGRCVYRCDNNVCDHMSILMEFEDGVTATFSLSAQTSACHRNIHIMCEDGEILADDGNREIRVLRHVSSQADTFGETIHHIRTNASGHGGGDAGIMEDFTASLAESGESRSSISRSVESHLMAFAIEQARLTGKVVDMDTYRQSLKETREAE
jgi:predicted dehydrogenase